MSVGVLRPGTAIPTEFNGITFRSRLEANVAQFLLDLGLKYEYESRSFLVNGKHYCPDFYLPDVDRYVEARGYLDENSENVLYLFARQHQGLFVFYSDKAEHLACLDDEIFRAPLYVIICDYSHASIGTLGSCMDGIGRDETSSCWLCSKDGRPHDRTLATLEIVMRSGVPVMVSEVYINRGRA